MAVMTLDSKGRIQHSIAPLTPQPIEGPVLAGCVCCAVPPSSFALTCLGPPCSSCASMLAVDPSASVNTTRDPDCTAHTHPHKPSDQAF